MPEAGSLGLASWIGTPVYERSAARAGMPANRVVPTRTLATHCRKNSPILAVSTKMLTWREPLPGVGEIDESAALMTWLSLLKFGTAVLQGNAGKPRVVEDCSCAAES